MQQQQTYQSTFATTLVFSYLDDGNIIVYVEMGGRPRSCLLLLVEWHNYAMPLGMMIVTLFLNLEILYAHICICIEKYACLVCGASPLNDISNTTLSLYILSCCLFRFHLLK